MRSTFCTGGVILLTISDNTPYGRLSTVPGETGGRSRDICLFFKRKYNMYWTLELASSLDDAPWPATKDELIDYANRSGAPEEVMENLLELEDDGEIYESIEDIWPDYPTKDDFFFNAEEY